MPKILIIVMGLAISGCATVKPEMSEADYNKFAKGFLAVDFCSWKGWITSETAVLGKRYIQSAVEQYTVDTLRFNNEVLWIKNNNPSPEQGECTQMAVAIRERQQSIVVNNQNVDRNQQVIQESLNSNRIRNTYCNHIGTQTLCNTY